MNEIKRQVMWVVLFFFVAATPLSVTAKGKRGKEPKKVITITYRIKKGDTLQKIAKKHRVKVSQLKRWNKGLDPKALRVGKKMRIAIINPDWRDWKNGKKKRKVPKSKAGKGSLPPTKLEQKSTTEQIEKMGLSLPTKTLPVAPTLDKPASATKKATPVDGMLEFKGEDLPVVMTREDLETIGPEKKVVYIPSEKDNVGSIALKFRLDPEELIFWNELDGLIPEVGKPLLLQSDREAPVKREMLPVTHRIRKGDSFQKVAKRYGVSVKKLRRWNKKVNPRKLRVGRTLTLYVPNKDGVSRSYGSANRGRLHNGVPLETTTGIRVRTVANSYGTERVVRLIKGIAFDVQARWPNAPDMVIGDISYHRGGRIKRHSSHQSGRDADITFYHRGNVELPDFRDMSAETFDAARNWYVFKTLIDLGEVEYIFIDYPLQRILYDYALSLGYTKDDLAPIIQYPQPRSTGVGIIRHIKGHDDHWHIRFKCGPLDTSCR